MRREDDEKKAFLEDLKEKMKNPLFRAANEQLFKKLEREIKEQEAEDKIRKYLRDENPGASFARVVLDTQVDVKIIEQLIADGRIDVKVSNQDYKELEAEQKQLLNRLSQIGGSLDNKNKAEQIKRESEEIRTSGMYSKKEKLSFPNQKKN
ncbi:MAG: hypothetical protein LBP78_04425 [Acidaminococcales bacterium]|jgi:hypothetical protein|nr:hypothetical protein [Acidaminococcales bacterium]